ncbi:inducible T-cell costimulator-like [Mixophyes fleayi]|uniref:inducible T-cell costimulator-like n=1 Tax=Mixophyes fleayi TaxID=3061075 RepID=UPI003F4DE5A7
MSICLVGFLLLISVQVAAQTTENSNPHVVIASRDGEVDLCKYAPQTYSRFNLTLEKGNDGDVVCLVYTSGPETKFHNWEDKARCRFNESNGTISLTLIELDVKHTDSYTCRLQTFVPPPFNKSIVNKAYVYVNDFEPPSCEVMSALVKWILIGVAVFLSTCFIVILYRYIQRKQCRECEARNLELTKEYNSEYMHMAAVPLARCPVR